MTQPVTKPAGYDSNSAVLADAGKYQAKSLWSTEVAAGRCGYGCGQPPTPGRSSCELCRKDDAKNRKLRREQVGQTQIAEGLARAQERADAKKFFDGRSKSKVLVVGIRDTNLPPWARSHSRVEYWTEDDINQGVPKVPTDVSVVLVSRFCAHRTTEKLREQQRNRDASWGQFFLFKGICQSGEIRDIVTELVGTVELEVVVPTLASVRVEPKATVDTKSFTVTQEEKPVAVVKLEPKQIPVDVDESIKLVDEAIAGLTIVREQLQSAKVAIEEAREATRRWAAVKELFK